MMLRVGVAVLLVLGLVSADAVQAKELHRAVGRPYLIEVGEPILVSRDLLKRELDRNSQMADFVDKYGWPDYVEVQEVSVEEPLAPYEVRMYYLRRNEEVAFTRVYVSPALENFGVRTYEGPIPPETLDRILTAKGDVLPPQEEKVAEILPETEPLEAETATEDVGQGDEMMAIVLRLEAAADRAALAAEMAERASKAACVSATRANRVLDKILVH